MDITDVFPDCVRIIVISFLDVRDLCSLSRCNKRWRTFCNSDAVWQVWCKKYGWLKYGIGCLNLLTLPSSDRLLKRTNVSGTSPKFEWDDQPYQHSLAPITRWKQVFIRTRHLQNNWSKGRYNVLPRCSGHESRVTAMDSDGTALVTCSSDKIFIWDLETMETKFRISGHGETINCAQIYGQKLATSCSDGAIRVFDLVSGRSLKSFQCRCAAEKLRFIDEDHILCSYADRVMRIWNIPQTILRSSLRAHTDEIECLAVQGGLCASGSWDHRVNVWDVMKGELIFSLQGHTDAVMCCEIDGDVILSGSGDGTVRLWDRHNGTCVQTLDGDTQEVYCLAFTSEIVAAAGSGSNIAIWYRQGYTLMHILRKHIGVVRTLRFNGSMLVSGGDRKMIVIWQAEAGLMLNTVHRNPDNLHLMWVNETKIITASPNAPGSVTVINYW